MMSLHPAQTLGYALLTVGYAASCLQGQLTDPALLIATGSATVILSTLFRRTAPLGGEAQAEAMQMRLGLSELLRDRRRQLGLTESELAARLGTRVTRIMKMEAADRRVPIDEFVSLLLSLGSTRREIGEALRGTR